MKTSKKSRNGSQETNTHAVSLRVPASVYARLKRIAQKEKRSVSSQTVFFLERWLSTETAKSEA